MSQQNVMLDQIKELSESPTKDDLVDFFASLPDRDSRAWEVSLVKLAEHAPKSNHLFYEIAVDPTHNHPEASDRHIRFSAYYAYCTYLRRHRNVSDFEDTLVEFREFRDEPMYSQLRALFLQLRGNEDDLKKAVREAERAAEQLEDQEGVSHNLALCIVEAIEKQAMESTPELLRKAETNVKDALRMSEYPRFFATYGRVLALKGDYRRARAEINKAIDKEDSTKQDYAIRLGNYQQHLSRVYLYEQKEALESRIDAALEEIESAREESESRISQMQMRQLQFLGFFATLLAVIISSVQIASAQPFPTASRLILVQIGGLLAAFGGLGILLPGKDVLKRSGLVFGAGAAVIILGILVPSLI